MSIANNINYCLIVHWLILAHVTITIMNTSSIYDKEKYGLNL